MSFYKDSVSLCGQLKFCATGALRQMFFRLIETVVSPMRYGSLAGGNGVVF